MCVCVCVCVICIELCACTLVSSADKVYSALRIKLNKVFIFQFQCSRLSLSLTFIILFIYFLNFVFFVCDKTDVYLHMCAYILIYILINTRLNHIYKQEISSLTQFNDFPSNFSILYSAFNTSLMLSRSVSLCPLSHHGPLCVQQ